MPIKLRGSCDLFIAHVTIETIVTHFASWNDYILGEHNLTKDEIIIFNYYQLCWSLVGFKWLYTYNKKIHMILTLYFVTIELRMKFWIYFKFL
jgi:hypothetical protein